LSDAVRDCCSQGGTGGKEVEEWREVGGARETSLSGSPRPNVTFVFLTEKDGTGQRIEKEKKNSQ